MSARWRGLVGVALLIAASIAIVAALIATILAALASPAVADSKNFALHGVCNGLDRPEDNPSGQLIEYRDAFKSPVWIRGVRVRLWPAGDAAFDKGAYVFAGNDDQHDIMGWGDRWHDESWRIEWTAPWRMSWRFGAEHIDLHVACTPVGLAWRAMMTIEYVQ